MENGSFAGLNLSAQDEQQPKTNSPSTVINLPQVVLEAEGSTASIQASADVLNSSGNSGANLGNGADSPESGSLYSDEIPSGYNSGEQYDTLSTG